MADQRLVADPDLQRELGAQLDVRRRGFDVLGEEASFVGERSPQLPAHAECESQDRVLRLMLELKSVPR